ncbi:MAG: hypothetical protein M3Q29_06275 [Chloroflexota bacterium]|nr:hypothetical protein [Chloroflexota bacterium]
MASQVREVASLVARGYTPSGSVPGGRYSVVFFWPWATIIGFVGALGLLGGTLLWLYRLLQFLLLAPILGVLMGG